MDVAPACVEQSPARGSLPLPAAASYVLVFLKSGGVFLCLLHFPLSLHAELGTW